MTGPYDQDVPQYVVPGTDVGADMVPGTRAPNIDAGKAVLGTIMESFAKNGIVLNDQSNQAIAEAVNAKLAAGVPNKDIISNALSDPAGAIRAGNGIISQLNPNAAGTGTDPLERAGLIKLANGNYYDPTHGTTIGPDGEPIRGAAAGASQTAAEQAASYAAAQSSLAQAGYYGAQAQHLASLEALAGTSPQAGYTYDATGNLVNTGKQALDEAAQKESARHNLAVEIANTQQNTDTANYQKGLLANAAAANGLTAGKNANDALFQQGQLANSSRLAANDEANTAINQGRLTLDQAKAAADTASQQQQNSLARDKYVQGVLSSPSDFIARAFTERGQASPTTPVTQADLINHANNEFSRLAPGQSFQGQTFNSPQQVNQPTTPALANGGTVNDRLMIVGDTQQPGKPNPEYVVNPTGAPLSVVPMNRLGQSGTSVNGYAEGTAPAPQQPDAQQVDPQTKRLQQAIDVKGKALQHINDPKLLHAMVDELVADRGRLAPPAYANGTPPAGLDVWGAGSASGATPGSLQGVPGYESTSPSVASTPATSTSTDYGALSAAISRGGGLRPPKGATYQGQAIDQSQVGYGPNGPYYTTGNGNIVHANELDSVTGWQPPVATPTQYSQQDIEAQADRLAPPAVRNLFGSAFGQHLPTADATPNPLQTGSAPLRFGFPIFSRQQLAGLTQDELKALNSYLGVKYNASLQDVTDAQAQTYDVPRQRYGRLMQ